MLAVMLCCWLLLPSLLILPGLRCLLVAVADARWLRVALRAGVLADVLRRLLLHWLVVWCCEWVSWRLISRRLGKSPLLVDVRLVRPAALCFCPAGPGPAVHRSADGAQLRAPEWLLMRVLPWACADGASLC